jgi:hypothetical protein
MQKNAKQAQYTEREAAYLLGIPVEQLRLLVRAHVTQGDEVPLDAIYYAADLVLLRFLATRALQSGEQWLN